MSTLLNQAHDNVGLVKPKFEGTKSDNKSGEKVSRLLLFGLVSWLLVTRAEFGSSCFFLYQERKGKEIFFYCVQ